MPFSPNLKKRLPLLPLLVYMTDLYDPYGRRHSKRVAELSIRLSKLYGFENTEEIELSALLHDVGKIGIPEYIRRLPGVYTESEYDLMKQHPAIGERLLRMVQNGTVDEIILLNVRHHHENWNGSGYPDGLQGVAIPLGSRIIRICDFYDAKTHVRGYDKALEDEAAIAFMTGEQSKNTWADPELFKMFLEMDRKDYT